jgi:hypothetical protein
VCSSASFAGGTPHSALLRTNRKQRDTMSETLTHPPIREINVRTPSYRVLANHRGRYVVVVFSDPHQSEKGFSCRPVPSQHTSATTGKVTAMFNPAPPAAELTSDSFFNSPRYRASGSP